MNEGRSPPPSLPHSSPSSVLHGDTPNCHDLLAKGEGQEGVLRGQPPPQGAPTCLRDGSENGEQPPEVIFQVSLSPSRSRRALSSPGPAGGSLLLLSVPR